MGSISITSDGVNGSFTYSTSWTPTASDLAKSSTGSFNPAFAKLWITGRGKTASATLPVSSTGGPTLQMSWSSSLVNIGWLRDCWSCSWSGGTYAIRIQYTGKDGLLTQMVIETGTVSVSGRLGCDDCEGGDGGEEEGDGEGGGGETDGGTYGPVSSGDDLPAFPSAPTDICIPPAFVAPAPAVPTPCSGGSGGGGSSTPGFN